MAKLIEKTTVQLVSALEDHLYLLSRTLRDLAEGDAGHMRQLATQLRALICKSSGLPGLLWRMCEELNVDDSVQIRSAEGINIEHPLTQGLQFAFVSTRADGSGPADVPLAPISLKHYIQGHEAFFIDGESISHEHLINRLANETGTAHEADGISRSIAKLNSFSVGDIQAYFAVVNEDAVLTLEVGERIVEKATEQGFLRRRPVARHVSGSKIELTKFSFKPDVPVISLNDAKGTIFFELEVPNLPSSKRLEHGVLFPTFTQGRAIVNTLITRRRKLQVSTTGLPLPYFSFECPLPEPLSNKLMIGISWNEDSVKAYVNGNQVAGPRAAA